MNKGIKIITMGVLDEKDIIEQIDRIRENKKLLAIVGTVDPKHPEVPFISAAEVLKKGGLNKLIEVVSNRFGDNQYKTGKDYKTFDKELILMNRKAFDKVEALNILANHLVKKGRVTPNFINEVLEREKFGATALGNKIAIPHGFGDEIIKPAIGIMTLKNPVEWCEGCNVSLIYMMAINEKSVHEFQRVFRIIKTRK